MATIDVKAMAEAAMEGKLESTAREVLVALEMVSLARSELKKADERLGAAIDGYEQERILCFLDEVTRRRMTWCSFHTYYNGGHHSYYSATRQGGLTEGLVTPVLVMVVKNCFHRGDHYGSDSEWTEQHVHQVCPDCYETIRDSVGGSVIAEARRVEKRDDGFYYKFGTGWTKVADDAEYFLAPQTLNPEWEEGFGIPPSLKLL